MLVGSVFFCMCGGLWKDCGTGRASFCHAYLLFVCDPPFVRSATCSSSLQDNGLNFCHQISFAGTHISATKVHLPPTTYNRLLSAVDPSPTIVLGFQKGLERDKSRVKTVNVIIGKRQRLVWGDTAIQPRPKNWLKRSRNNHHSPLEIATEADQSSPGATVCEAEHKMKNK